MSDVDPFYTFRTAIFVGVSAYTLVALAGTLVRLVAFLRSDDPATRFIRRYVSYQLVTVRLRPLAGELAQIAAVLLGLWAVWWAHGAMDKLGA